MRFTLNGKEYDMEVPAHYSLLRLLRETLGLTGTKEGCGNGECGACTVIMDDVPVRSCLVLAAEIAGRRILTIEGLAHQGELSRIQQAFVENGAIQCGFCTPGFVMAVYALLQRYPQPDRAQISEALSGHLCRCTGYEEIFKAVEKLSLTSVAI